MKAPRSVRTAEDFGRVRLSPSFYMRDFLHSEIGDIHGISNLPDDPDLAIMAGKLLCEHRHGFIGAMASIVVPWFADRYATGALWQAMAWWIHDHLPYSELQFFPKLAAFNIGWHEQPKRRIYSFIVPRGLLTKPGMANHAGSHAEQYPDFPQFVPTPPGLYRKA